MAPIIQTLSHRTLFSSLALCCALLISSCAQHQTQAPVNAFTAPDQRYGDLFIAVQESSLFADSKTFVDATARTDAETIMAAYYRERGQAGFDLSRFVNRHFEIPGQIASDFVSDTSVPVDQHITQLWDVLTRQPDGASGSSLIPLPQQYVVPGGRFREIYYWDSYFTLLGLVSAGRLDLVESMVDNFAYLIDTLGFIPNGNRSYYLSRSQPPFYALMVGLLAEQQGDAVLLRYRESLLKEYQFWMQGEESLSARNPAHRRVVRLPDGGILNRYWDNEDTPRPESWREDVELAETLAPARPGLYRDIRAAAESGWDFSSRWFADGRNMNTIHTTDIIPVDLNSLLTYHELLLARAFELDDNYTQATQFKKRAEQRKRALMAYSWDETGGFFRDYNLHLQQQTPVVSLAGLFPLFLHLATDAQAARVAERVERDFLQQGGVTTTLANTGQQWDAPNGWAPLQWVTIQGLRNYQHQALADTIQQRWIALNTRVYQRTGKLLEKYNVYDSTLEGGGGEYPVQDGFGWTNGVLLRLMQAQ